MKIKKDDANFDIYRMEITYGELLTIKNALESAPGIGPEADEILQGLGWYIEKIPGPGEEADKGEGSANSPDLPKSQADDALDGIELLPAAPGESPAPESEHGEKAQGPEDEDEDYTLPEPPRS